MQQCKMTRDFTGVRLPQGNGVGTVFVPVHFRVDDEEQRQSKIFVSVLFPK